MNNKAPNISTEERTVLALTDRRTAIFLGLILLAAFALRVIALLDLKNSIYFDFMLWDERLYHGWAVKIADGTFQSGQIYEFAPLPAYFMALVYWIFGPDIVYIRYVNILFGVATCYLLYRIGRELAGPGAGLVAACIAALYKPLIFYSIVPLKTSLAVFLFAAGVCFLLAAFDNRSPLNFLALGVFLGLVNGVRPNAAVLAVFAPLLLVWVLWQGKSSLRRLGLLLLLYGAGLVLALSPFMVRNYLMGGHAAPTTSQAGFHLYLSNNFDFPKGVQFATTDPRERGIQFTIEASRRVKRTLTPREASAYWTGRVVESIQKQPARHLKHFGRKALLFFNWFEKGDHYDIPFISRFVPFFKLPFLPFWLVLPFAMAGMALLCPESKRAAGAALFFFIYGATLVLFFTDIRMRIPVMTLLIPFAAGGAFSLLQTLRERRFKRAGIYGATAAAFFVITFLPIANTKDTTAFLNTHAIALYTQGRQEEAVGFWERSSKEGGIYSAYADLALAGIYLRKGDRAKVGEYLKRIPDDSFAAALKYDKIGDFMVYENQSGRAIEAYRKALSFNSGFRPPRSKMVQLLERMNPRRARLEYDRLRYINSFYDLYGARSTAEPS